MNEHYSSSTAWTQLASEVVQSAGQLTYQDYLQGLNDVIPQLRDAAYQMYCDEGDGMLTDISLLQGLDQSDYGHYRDDMSDYFSDLDHYNMYNTAQGQENLIAELAAQHSQQAAPRLARAVRLADSGRGSQ